MSKTKKGKIDIFSKGLLIIQLLLSLSLFAVIAYFQILPIWALAITGIVLFGLLYLVYVSVLKKKRSKTNIALGRLLSIFLSVMLLFGNIVAFNAAGALDRISGANYKIDAISVIVKSDSNYQNIVDVKSELFGIPETIDLQNTTYAIESINKELNSDILIEGYSDFNSLVTDLYDNHVKVIIVNEAFRGLIEEAFPSFSNDTRVIHQVEKKSEVVTNVQEGFDVTKDPFNVYLSGIDTYGPVSTTSRSDVNMIISINPKTKQVLLTNIPRDYYVPLACQGGAMDKLTHAGVYGVDCSVNTLANFMGIDISYYARVNFSSLINVVDALGGIEAYSEYSFTAITGDQFYSGMNKMDGKKALAFSRERKALPGGDRDRGKNQQAVIQGIVNKAKSPAIVSNYTKVIDAVSGSFQTNMSSQDISKLIKMQLGDMAEWTITSTSLNGTGASSTTFSYGSQPLYVMVPDMATVADAKAKIEAIFQSGDSEE